MTVVQSEGALVAAHRPMTPGLARGITLYDGAFEDYAAVYRTQPNVRLVNGFLARNIAQLGLKAFHRVSDVERQTVDRAHPLSRLVRRPNPYTTRYAFVDAMVHDLGIYDVFAAIKLRNRQTDQLNLFRLPPYMVEPIGDSWLVADGYRLLGTRARPEIPRDQMVVIHGYNPGDPRVGTSPIESLRRLLAEEAAAGEWREQYWRGAARMSGVIERPMEAPNWSDPARARFRSDFQGTYAGSGTLAGATPVLEEGMVWKEASFSPKDSEYLGARRLSREETAAFYFVSPLFVGILDHANFSNVSEQHKHLYQDTLGPRLVQIEEEFELQVLPEFADLDPDLTYLEFNLAEKLKGTFEEQATVLQTLVGAPVMTRNEGRARLNLSPVDGGDQLVTPLNVLIGGQASPRDSSPATASRHKLELPAGRKAVEDLPADVQGWHAKHVDVLSGFFSDQGAEVGAALAEGQGLDEAWDVAEWDAALGAHLLSLSATMAADVATPVAERFGGAYDEALAFAFLEETSRIGAENINASTRAAVAEALATPTTGTASRRKADDEEDPEETDPLELVAEVFALAAGTRAAEIATTRVTSVGNFARHEGAAQAGVPSKVWIITSARPRADHPTDGETVAMDGTFSNGARWPGDSAAGVDQTAGCTCALDFSTEEP